MQSFELKFLGVTILQGVEFPVFLLIFEWALQQCSATALPVIHLAYTAICGDKLKSVHKCNFLHFLLAEYLKKN